MRADGRHRERALARLRAAFGGGAIGVETLELRVGLALASRTRSELARLVDDLPVPVWRRVWDAICSAALGERVLVLASPPDVEVGEGLVVGRQADASLVVDDPRVSRRHLMLRRARDGWIAEDLGSTNGTYVNGWRIRRARLGAGDVVRIGDTRLRIREPHGD
jgi:hypothetical protein